MTWKWVAQLKDVFERNRKYLEKRKDIGYRARFNNCNQAARDRAQLVEALNRATSVCDELRDELVKAGVEPWATEAKRDAEVKP